VSTYALRQPSVNFFSLNERIIGVRIYWRCLSYKNCCVLQQFNGCTWYFLPGTRIDESIVRDEAKFLAPPPPLRCTFALATWQTDTDGHGGRRYTKTLFSPFFLRFVSLPLPSLFAHASCMSCIPVCGGCTHVGDCKHVGPDGRSRRRIGILS
jgi:hypothetical protein